MSGSGISDRNCITLFTFHSTFVNVKYDTLYILEYLKPDNIFLKKLFFYALLKANFLQKQNISISTCRLEQNCLK